MFYGKDTLDSMIKDIFISKLKMVAETNCFKKKLRKKKFMYADEIKKYSLYGKN